MLKDAARKLFQSTPSARRATCDSGLLCFAILDFNPRPPRGERLIGVVRCSPAYMISIHALREESDEPLSPGRYTARKFQSTPSARRATACSRQNSSCSLNFNPRPPRGERLTARRMRGAGDGISIHALREESDVNFHHGVSVHALFQSTPSARRATLPVFPQDAVRTISIHALREESDASIQSAVPNLAIFQSTPSARRATAESSRERTGQQISIHALREEGDYSSFSPVAVDSNFNPRPPRGGRRQETR